ncbi:MAG TPA: amino acid adenylation domain-containing protein, partial [Pyrinomonadaceae bacterium]|nr:amino acid adenylation domain-containing protein [Pyrinomonadaceae bacterium]
MLRTDLTGDPTFVELLGREREVCLGAYAHQDVPFERVVEELQPERELSHAPLFQVMFALQNAPVPSVATPGLSLGPVEVETGTSMFDLSLSLEETARGLAGVFEYSTDLFDAATVERMSSHFRNLLEGVAANAGQRLSELPLLGERERRRLLVEWNETREDYALDKCLHELFEEQAARTPEAVALVFEGERLTYGELNASANRLAHHLIAVGVGPEVIVGFCVERSPEMVVGLLGIMKAGGAYMPLEPEYPRERLAFMLRNAGGRVLLTEKKFAGLLPQEAERVVLIDEERERVAPRDERNPSSGVAADNLIYVIYTSGSTGEPKGAMLAHRGVSNCLLWLQQTHRLAAADRVLLKAPLSFDSSVWELFWPLLVGAGVVIARPGEQRDSAYLVDLIARARVTTVHFVPSMFQVFLEEKGVEACDSLRRVVCGGEALSPAGVARFRERLGAELHNFYGPTETSIGSINWPCDEVADRRTLPIGRPVANTRSYILDRHLRPVPVGVHGELHTGGVGVARGYLSRPGLTAERFIPDPFGPTPGARLYRTGDVARYLPDGSIDFLGRIDHQVKLRGLRIELGEIEAALESHPSVRDAAVVMREDVPGDKRLAAYLVPQQGASLSSSELRGFLKERLPDFMLPSAFVLLDEMPLTHNVKIDRRALPAPGDARAAEAERPYVAPRTPVEEVVASVWAGVLGLGRVGAQDNFFDLGGHSLLATQVMSRVREAFGVELPLRTLFESPTVSGLALAVERGRNETRASTTPELVPSPREGAMPLSFAQQRLWFLDQLVPGSPFYNIPSAVRLSGRLDGPALERALSEVVRRHEILHTTFPSIDGEPVQLVGAARPCELPLIDLSSIPAATREEEARRLASQEAREPFDLARGPLLRARLLRLSEDEHVLLLTMHHIVSDAWSAGVLVRELTTIYEAFAEGRPSPLEELPIQYADYAAWQRRLLQGATLEEQLDYWRGRLAGAPASLELPTIRTRPAVKSHKGRTENFTLPGGLAEALRSLARREGVTLFMLLSAGFKALLARYSGQQDIAVGTPVANRTRGETEGLIGFFVNTLVLRTDMSGDPTFLELVRREREVCLGAYAHQDVPFERVVEELQPERDLSRTPLFQVMFSLQNESGGPPPATPRGLRLRPLAVEGGTAKFDLTFVASESGDGRLACALEYDAELFDEATAKRMSAHWTRLLEGVVREDGARLSELPLLADDERRQLIIEWSRANDDEAAGDGANDDGKSLAGDARSLTSGEDGGAASPCVHELFERRAALAPEAVAVVCGGEELTYGELNARANRLARYLRASGVGQGHLVGVFVERSAEMSVALLGVLKAGGAYLPLDPEYPRERPQRFRQPSRQREIFRPPFVAL